MKTVNTDPAKTIDNLIRACFAYRTAIRYLRMMVEEDMPKESEFDGIQNSIDYGDSLIDEISKAS